MEQKVNWNKHYYVNKHFRIGNVSLYKNIFISNLSPYKYCPARLKKICYVENKLKRNCYNKQTELMYPATLDYRIRQMNYWNNTNIVDIISDIQSILKKRDYLEYFRLDETGDFDTQEKVNKISDIAYLLKRDYNIITYTYTCRYDFDFSNCHFIVRGSGFNCKNGKVIIIDRKDLKQYESNKKWFVCQKTYGKICGLNCKACMNENIKNIAIVYHGPGLKK